MKRRLVGYVFTLLIIPLLVSLACNTPFTSQDPTETPLVPTESPADEASPAEEQPEPTTTIVTPVEVSDVHPSSFSDYPAVNVRLPSSFQLGYSLPLDLSQVDGLELFDFTSKEREMLVNNGFVVRPPVPGMYREFYQVYEISRYGSVPVFVTLDSVLHVYHLIFDKMLRDLEREFFIPDLESLTLTMQQASLEQFHDLRGTALEEQARRNLAFFTVAAHLLELNSPIEPDVVEYVNAELTLIDNHAGVSISPIWDRPDMDDDDRLIEDYSQYVPRGHYTRSDELKRYFKAMMWFGRLTFRMQDEFETQRALLLCQALRNSTDTGGTPATTLWQNIFEPTVFIVGKADDLSYTEYGVISDAVFGDNPDPLLFADELLMARFLETAKQLPPPQINSMWVYIWQDRDKATRGFRFMGQRFTLDAYVFGQVMWRKVGTLENPRDLPKGLDFFAAMGSEEALNILEEMGETEYLNYTDQMNKVIE